MTDKPTPKEIDDLVHELRQAGKDDTYSLASAVLEKWGTPAPVGAELVALLVRKNSWRDGQWEAAPPNSPSYGLAWAHQRVYVYTTPQPTQTQPVAREPLTYEQIQDLLLCGNPTDEEMRLIRIGWDAAHGIKGGQHVS